MSSITISKSELLKNAWIIARVGVERFGGTPRDYFASALKLAWADARIPQGKYPKGGHQGRLDAKIVELAATIKRGQYVTAKNIKGVRYQLSHDRSGLWSVWAHCENYKHGRMIESVRLVDNNLDYSKALAIFLNRVNSKRIH